MIDVSTNLIGYAGTAIGTILMLPQVIKIWREKKAGDISIITAALYILNCILWFWYGCRISANPVILANGIGGIIGIVLFVLKFKYDYFTRRNVDNQGKRI